MFGIIGNYNLFTFLFFNTFPQENVSFYMSRQGDM